MSNTLVWQLANILAVHLNEKYQNSEFKAMTGDYSSYMNAACMADAVHLHDEEVKKQVESSKETHAAVFVANLQARTKDQILIILSHPPGRDPKFVSVELVCRSGKYKGGKLVETVIEKAKSISDISHLIISPSQKGEEKLTKHYKALGFKEFEDGITTGPSSQLKQPVFILKMPVVPGGVSKNTLPNSVVPGGVSKNTLPNSVVPGGVSNTLPKSWK